MNKFHNPNTTQKNDSTFLAMVIHDLKTPIIAEICALELLLKNKPPNSFEHDLINDMLGASKYMKTLVENLLLKYKTEKNELKLQLELCPIETIIEKSIEEIRYLTKDKKQKITFKNETKDSICEVDFIEIKRTINNLLTNANQYSPHNTTITITLKETTTNFIIEITNQTILTEKQYYFTNPLDQHIETKSVNTGLGLYICKQIIELHNGKIEQKIAKNQNKIQLFLPKIKQHLTSQK